MLMLLLVGILWILTFQNAKTSFIVMMATSTFYFEGDADVTKSFILTYTKHYGSVGLGSLMITVTWFFRITFGALAEQTVKLTGENRAVRTIVKCSECTFRAIENFNIYINFKALPYMAISGNNFLKSAWSGFVLDMKHGLPFRTPLYIASAFILVG
jgi:hypothetical protein